MDKCFIRYVFCNYFLQVYDLSFHFINDVFWRDSAFNFDKNKFVNYFSFINQDLGIISKKSLWIKKRKFFSYDFFYKFYSLDFYIRLIVHFNLFVINGIKYGLQLNWFSSIHWNDYFLSIEWYLELSRKSYAWVYFWTLWSLPLVYVHNVSTVSYSVD